MRRVEEDICASGILRKSGLISLTICGFCVTIEERRTRNNIPLCLPIYLDIAFLDYLGSVINYSYGVV
jgi:hypothetical protein